MSHFALAPGHAREYETIYILRPNLERELADGVATRVVEAIKGQNGSLTEAELWGHRRLAYPIQRHHRGTYVYLKFLGTGDTVNELERQLRLADSVIRHQTIQLRDNVPLAGAAGPDDSVKLDFEIPFEADEPEVTRERELGLDIPVPERRRRDFNRDRAPQPEKTETEGAKKDAGDKKEAAAAAPDADKASAEAAAPEGAKKDAGDKKEAAAAAPDADKASAEAPAKAADKSTEEAKS